MPVALRQQEVQDRIVVVQRQEERLVQMQFLEIETTGQVEAPEPHPAIEAIEPDAPMVLHRLQEVAAHTEEELPQVEVQPYPVHRAEALGVINLPDEPLREAAIIEDLLLPEVLVVTEVGPAEEATEVRAVAQEVIEALAAVQEAIEVPVAVEAAVVEATAEVLAVEEAQVLRVHHQEVVEDDNISHCFI